MAQAEPTDRRPPSTAELLKELGAEISMLVRQEIELAKAEVSEKGKRFGIGAGMFGGAGVAGLLALGALTACLILALAIVMPAAIAAFVIALLYGGPRACSPSAASRRSRRERHPSRSRPWRASRT